MALGAEGVQLGTRFVAVDENIAHPTYKQAIVQAQDTDTVITSRKLVPTRSLKTEFSGRLLELEASGASPEVLREFLGRGRARRGQIEGDLVNGEFYCGTSAGLIKEVLPVAEVIQKIGGRIRRDYQGNILMPEGHSRAKIEMNKEAFCSRSGSLIWRTRRPATAPSSWLTWEPLSSR